MAEGNTGVFDFAEVKRHLDRIGVREVIARPIRSYQSRQPVYGSPAWVCGSCGQTKLCDACMYGD